MHSAVPRWPSFVVLSAFALAAGFLPEYLWGSQPFVHEPLHSTIEAVGALAAITTAVLLLRRAPDDASRAVPAAVSFLGMGILDGIHALSLPGQSFVLLHSFASLAGALGFVVAWVPSTMRRSRKLWTRKLPATVAAASLALGLMALFRPATFPAVLRDREFTAAGIWVNGAAGALFLLSAVPFLVGTQRSRRHEELLFGSMALLFGAAELLVPFSALWDAQWWSWHAVRLAAYCVALWLSQSYVAGLRAAEQVARQQAQQAIRAREDLLAVVSHDLRSPLSSITLSATTFSNRSSWSAGDGGAGARKAAETILRSADQMNRLISDLLDAARIEAGGLSVAQGRNDAAALVGEAVESIRPLAERRRLTMEQRVAGGLPPILSDRERILQVLANLVGNSVKFTPEGGAITITAEGEGEAVRFTVADTGPGIPSDALPHLFDRYWQASHTRRAGAGLGLYIAKGIVEAHGGRLWAESAPGRGSTFSFTLPTARPPEDHQEAAVP
jgi:signal transduction histidine kinase